jgi:hypothetical protein
VKSAREIIYIKIKKFMENDKKNLILLNRAEENNDKIKFFGKNRFLKVMGLLPIIYIIIITLYILITFQGESGCVGAECGSIIILYFAFLFPLFFLALIYALIYLISLFILSIRPDRFDKIFLILNIVFMLPFLIVVMLASRLFL